MLRLIRVSCGLFAVAMILASLFNIPIANAQENNGALNLTTSPLPLSIKAKPGEKISLDLRVKNSGTVRERLRVTLFKFGANGEDGQPRLIEREDGDTYFDWVTFSDKSFMAEPNVWKTVKMNINIPKDAGLGYYYAPVFSRATGDDAVDAGAAVQGGTATLVLLDVDSPNAKRELQVSEFSSEQRVYEFLPATFIMRIRNSGNIFVAPAGSVFISKGDKQIETVDFNTLKGNILPQSDRRYTATWKEGFPKFMEKIQDDKIVNDKDGNAEMELKVNFADSSKFRFGKYKASLLVVYDDGQRDVPIEAVVEFWVIPWRIIGVIVVLLLLIGFGIYSIFRNVFKTAGKFKKKKSSSAK